MRLTTPSETELQENGPTVPIRVGQFGTGRGFDLLEPEPATPPATTPTTLPTQEPAAEPVAELVPPYIICPLTGERVLVEDIDALTDLYLQLDSLGKQIYDAILRIRRAMAAQTEGDAKTRRLRGARHTIKIEMPSDTWDNTALRKAWDLFPAYRDQYLRVARVDPQMREVKKMVNTSSNEPEFLEFRDMVTAANRGPVGTPTIKVEA